MNKWLNGKLVEMTEEEVAKVETRQAAFAEQTSTTTTTTERLEKLETALTALTELLTKWGIS